MGPRSLVSVALVSLLVFVSVPVSAQEQCEQADLVRGASRPGVRGVVERTPVASNPLPWGTTMSAVTRVWGGVVVERWGTDSEVPACHRPVDVPSYQAVGTGDRLIPVTGTISGLELAALQARFGPPVTFEPGGFDRFMAWLRVFPSVPVVAALVLWALVALRRRRHRSDGYLF